MFDEWLGLIGVTFGALLPIANPFSAAPVFASLSSRMSPSRRNQQARMAGIYMAAVLLVTLFAGVFILNFFGISMPALRIAGGLVVARVGFSMLNPAPEEDLTELDETGSRDTREIAFTPIAMPLLSGPGSIAVTISMATQAKNSSEYIAVGVGILLVSLVSWIIVRSSTRVLGVMGSTGVDALTRVMGLILVCIGIQFIFTGFFQAITDARAIAALTEAFSKLR